MATPPPGSSEEEEEEEEGRLFQVCSMKICLCIPSRQGFNGWLTPLIGQLHSPAC
jgi:hypothetical protein